MSADFGDFGLKPSNIGGFGGFGGFGGKPEGVEGKGSGFEQLLEAAGLSTEELDALFGDARKKLDDQLANADSDAASADEMNEFLANMLSMLLDSGNGPSQGKPDFQSDQFADRFTSRFGEEAFASIQDESGQVDPELLRDFMQEQRAAMGNAEMIGKQGGMGIAPMSSENLTALLMIMATNQGDLFDTGEDSESNVEDTLSILA